VKGLSRSTNAKRDTVSVPITSSQRETNISPPPVPFSQPSQQAQQVPEYQQQLRTPDRSLWSNILAERERVLDQGVLGREESNRQTLAVDKERINFKDNGMDGLGNLRDYSSAPGGILESQEPEKHQLVLPSRRKAPREEKVERSLATDRNLVAERNASSDRNLLSDRPVLVDRNVVAKEEAQKFDGFGGNQRRHNIREDPSLTASQFTFKEQDNELDSLQTGYDGHINAILEVNRNSCSIVEGVVVLCVAGLLLHRLSGSFCGT
jgi:hypothetical protein